jgi:hypothetical protein
LVAATLVLAGIAISLNLVDALFHPGGGGWHSIRTASALAFLVVGVVTAIVWFLSSGASSKK